MLPEKIYDHKVFPGNSPTFTKVISQLDTNNEVLENRFNIQ